MNTENTENDSDSIQLTNWDCMQITACYSGLHMAVKHNAFPYSSPSQLRAVTSELLTKARIKHNPKAKWSTLKLQFLLVYMEIVQDLAMELERK